MSLPRGAVVAAADAWVWWPDNAEVFATEEFTLVRFPEWSDADLVLLRFEPGDREVTEVVAEVLATATTTGAPELFWWVKLGSPETVERLLDGLGARLDETLDVLALDLTSGEPDLGQHGLETRWVEDVETLRASHTVLSTVFGGAVPPDDRLYLEAMQTRADHAQGNGGAVVAFLDGQAVGTGGLSVVDGVARLWSGSVLESARGRGAYRALLAERLRYGVEHGCALALVKGRVETSGPILRRAGFAPYGQERGYVISLTD